MKKYNNFILEELSKMGYPMILKNEYLYAATKLSIEDAVEHCIMYCQDFINNPKVIDRYLSDTDPDKNVCFISDPIKRRSRDNGNHYTLLMDNSPYWKGYPKRSESFICTMGKR